MRKFFLTNAAGERWNLMRFDAFFHAPDGLGFSQTISSARVGTDYIETDAYLDQHVISGEMVFLNYEIYQQFADFALQAPLVLTYMPDATEYYIRCKVQNIGKTEIGSANRLICPISFLCSGTWYERMEVVVQSEGIADDAKEYTYSYNYTYSDLATAGALIQNGAVESPLILHVFGNVTNPTWSLTHDGETVATGAVTAEIPAGHKLVVDARPASMEIAEYTNGGVYVRDLYPMSDFSTARFLYAPAGESTVLVMSGDTVAQAIVEVEKYAYTV